MIFVISHNDMDGYGCILSARKAYPDCRYLNISYDSIISTLNYLNNDVLQKEYFEQVFITDLNFGEMETIELYKVVKHNPTVQFTYLDHHPYESEKQHKIFDKMRELGNFKFVHTDKYCATYIFYKYLLKQGLFEFNEDYDKLMKIIDVFDTWKQEDPLFKAGLALNDVFYTWTKERFIGEMLKEMRITPKLKEEMKSLTERKNTFFKELQEKGFIIPFGETLLFLSDNYISHMTIDYPGYKYYINGRSYGGLSVRISQEVENAKDVKNYLVDKLITNPWVVSSGGHDHAFGVTLDREHKDKMVPIAEILIKAIAEMSK